MKVCSCLFFLVCLYSAPVWAKPQAAGQKAGPTTIVDLSGSWQFAYTPSHADKVPEAAAFEKAAMRVPGCWDDQIDQSQAKALWKDAQFNPDYHEIKYPMDAKPPDASLPYLRGAGWYLKQLEVPEDWRGRQVTLRVGRVVLEGWVYVNGREVHHHIGHATPWEVSLGPHLKFGRTNQIVIAVANTGTGRGGCIVRGWKGHSAGIFGPVSIKVAGAIRIADLFVYPEDGKLAWRVELEGPAPIEGRLKWKVRDPKTGQSLGEGSQIVEGGKVQWITPTLGIRPWSDRQPTLVEIETSLWSGGKCLDVHRQPFGLRRLTRDGVRLRLSGNMIYLRGVCDHAYFAKTCTPPLDIESYRSHVRRLKEVGFNWIRFHTWVPTELYMQAADELGILLQIEPPVGYELTDWRDIMRCCRKHPSVVIYCCGNEELLDEAKIEFLRQCAAELRESVPDALFNPQEALRGIEYGWSKSDTGKDTVKEPFPHNPKRLEKLQEFSDVFGQYTWGWLSYGTLGGNHEAIDQRLVIYKRPCLSHEMGIIGCYLNLDLESRYKGTRIGPDLYAKVRQGLRQVGLLDRAALYYRNSAAWQRLIYKDAIEMGRKCRLITGYDLLGANDAHWHRTGYSCGIMNEFDELKPGDSVADVLRYNGESVLLIGRQRQRILLAGQPVTRDMLVSWFTPRTLRGATLQWHLTAADGSILGTGRQSVDRIEPGTVTKIATASLTVPKLSRPTKATLSVELSDEQGKIDNRWDYWIFPTVSDADKPGVTVVSSLDAACLKKLLGGGRVVLVGRKPFPARSTSFQMGLAGRPRYNHATVIAKHPLADRFPHDGYCDWQFYKMLDGASAVLFAKMDDVEMDGAEMNDIFDPILEVVSSYKNIRKQAALFEWRVGAGKLLVCTLNLRQSNPAAAYLRHCILDYASGDKFRPRTKIEPHRLAKILKLDPPKLDKKSKTDEAFDERGQLPKKKK